MPFMILALCFSACMPLPPETPQPNISSENIPTPLPELTPLPTRPAYQPGEWVDYLAQTGDTLPALAARFNTTEREIRTANPAIPPDVTTLPHGMPMKIPIYYLPLWGTPYQIIPDWLFVNGPTQTDFNTVDFVNSQPGWLKDFTDVAGGYEHVGGELVDIVAENFSISPRLLLAIIEYQIGGLSNPRRPESINEYALGNQQRTHLGFYQQLVWAANTLNNGYYGWRKGKLLSFDLLDGSLERPDPWQNAATVSLQYYFSRVLPKKAYQRAIYANGLALTYQQLFGDPWQNPQPHIPVSLQQPEFRLPFETGKFWAFTGGPHTGWGEGEPLAALDFAPPAVVGGCSPTSEWATAVADGVVVRSSPAVAVLDLDMDNNERTGWVVFYMHLATPGRAPVGTVLKAGAPIGLPSCEGGRSTGTHVHIARKYNGEWIAADWAVLPFNLEGWIARGGASPYQGNLIRFSQVVRACVCSDKASQLESRPPLP